MRQGRQVGRDRARLAPSGVGSDVPAYGGPRIARCSSLGDVQRGEAQRAEDEVSCNAVAAVECDLERELTREQRDGDLHRDLVTPGRQPQGAAAVVDALQRREALAVGRADADLDDRLGDRRRTTSKVSVTRKRWPSRTLLVG